MKHNPARFFLIFALFWSAIVLIFDVFLVRTFVHQIRSLSYVSTEGRISSSEITTHDGSDSTTYGAKVVYEFSVDGHRYQSDRVRFGQGSDSKGSWARATVQANPSGAVRPVYYDAANPAESVLQTGAGRQDWFLALFLTPFNVAMIFLWAMAVNTRRPSPPYGGARVVTQPGQLQVHLQSMPRAGAALMAFGVVSFVGIFVLIIPNGFAPKPEYVWSTWAMASVVALISTRKGKTPTPDLIIDADQGHLSLPRGRLNAPKSWSEFRALKKAGYPPLIIPFENVKCAALRERVTKGSDGDSRSYVVALSVAESEQTSLREHDLGSWMLPERAEAFAAWLRETLNVPAEARDADSSSS